MSDAGVNGPPGRPLRGVSVLVTGATGFIGAYVVEALADAGAVVVAVDGPDRRDRPDLTATLNREAVTHVEMPQRWPYRRGVGVTAQERFAEVVPLLGEVDAVVHFAYSKPRSEDGRALTGVDELEAEFRLNVLPGLELLQLAGSDIGSFCFASSGLVYGQGHQRPVTEDDPALGDTAYGLGKLAVEQAVTAWAARPDTGAGTSLRIPTVYGPGETAPRAIPNFIRRCLAGMPPQIEVADDRRDYIAAVDVAAGVLAVTIGNLSAASGAGSACGPVLNIATGVTYSTVEVARMVIDHLGVDVEPDVGAGGRAPLKHELDSQRLRAQTDWRPTVKLVDGLAAQTDWIRSHPHLWS